MLAILPFLIAIVILFLITISYDAIKSSFNIGFHIIAFAFFALGIAIILGEALTTVNLLRQIIFGICLGSIGYFAVLLHQYRIKI